MKLVIGSDLSGFPLKNEIIRHLEEAGHSLEDLGTLSADAVRPFFKTASAVAEAVRHGRAERGILVCGTGMGMAQVAGKFHGIRAACVESVYAAKMCRSINDANVLCMGGWIIGEVMGLQMVDVFLNTGFTEGLEDWRAENLRKARVAFDEIEAAQCAEGQKG